MRRSPRNVLVLLAATVFGLGTAVVTSQPAQATTCQISVSGFPSKVTIDSTDQRYWVKATASGCSNLDRDYSEVYADTYGPNSAHTRNYDFIDPGFETSSDVELGTSDYKAGAYTIRDTGSSIVDSNYDDIHYTWVTKTFVAKYRTSTSLSAQRSGKYVTVKGKVTRYAPAWWDYVGYKTSVHIQRYRSGAWHTIKTVTSTGGKYSYKYRDIKRYKYRAQISEQSSTIASTSGTHAA